MTPAVLPLAGKRILVTRRGEQAGSLTSQLVDLGATVVELPLIEVRPPQDPAPLQGALRDLGSYAWIVLTSANAVDAVAEGLETLGLAVHLPPKLLVASVGSSTSEAFARAFPEATVAVEPAEEFRAEGLLRELEACPIRGKRILMPLSDRAADTLARGLADRGAQIDRVTAYRTVSPEDLPARLRAVLQNEDEGGIDLVTLASPSAVEHFTAALAGRGSPPVAVIGPVTDRAARAAGLTVAAVAAPSTAQGLVDAIRRVFG